MSIIASAGRHVKPTSPKSTPAPADSPVRAGRIPFDFHALPKQLLREGELSFGAVVLFSVVRNLAVDQADGSRVCRKSNAALAAELGRSPSVTRGYLVELEEAGLIRRIKGDTERSRNGIVVTWAAAVDQVDHRESRDVIPMPTVSPMPEDEHGATSTHAERPASPMPGNRPSHAGRSASTHAGNSASLKNSPEEREEISQERAIPDFHPCSRGEEDPPGDPKPTAEEVAKCMRDMIAGRFAPLVFEEKPAIPPGSECSSPPALPGVRKTDILEPKKMFREVGFSAVAAAGFKKRPLAPVPRDAEDLRRMREARRST